MATNISSLKNFIKIKHYKCMTNLGLSTPLSTVVHFNDNIQKINNAFHGSCGRQYPCDVHINTSTNQQTHHFMSIFLYIK